jgi:hypothetical protein
MFIIVVSVSYSRSADTSVQDEVKVLGRIGEGAFGEVSLATCAIFGKVAVKWLKVWLLTASLHM